MEWLKSLFGSDGFMPHGHCYLWDTRLVWLHVVSDSFIALAYYSIPVALVYFVRKRTDLPYHWMFLAFGTFILACGTTHIMEVWTVWNPSYWMSGLVKVFTATVSIVTAALLWPLIPKALALPSPKQLADANRSLQLQAEAREKAQRELQKTRDQLEDRVQERTADLQRVNEALREEIAERKRTEQALKQSEERYRTLVSAITSVVWTTDAEGAFTTPQSSWEAYTGQSWEQHRGWGWTSVLHPEDHERVKAIWSDAVSLRVAYESEGRIWHAPTGGTAIAPRGACP